MKTKFNAWLIAAVVSLLVVGLTTPVSAAEKASATGTWKWSFTPPNGGQARETILKLKQDGEKLTGAVIGRNDTETAIEEGKVKDGEVTFKITRERNGTKTVMTYKGKLSEDTIKGTIGREGQDPREWEAKRVKEEKK
jgi:hypothetical protein